MDFVFDHIVHYVENPNGVIREFAKKGIHAVVGGEHRNRPTYNTLSYFDLSYIEFIGTSDKKMLTNMEHPQHSMIKTIINSGFTEGFCRFILSTNDIEAVAAHFKSAGLQVEGPVYLSRNRPDGSLLEWQLLFVGDENGGLELPYFIQWNEGAEERRTDLIEKNVIVEHPSKSTFSHISLAVHDLESTVEKWADLLKLSVGEVYIDQSLRAKCQKLTLPGGDLVFASPIEQGIVAEVLKNHGEKPFQVNLASPLTEDFFEVYGGRYKMLKK